MELRFRALARKTPHSKAVQPSVIDSLVSTLVGNISSNGEFHRLLRSGASVAEFGRRTGLTPEQQELLTRMQEQKHAAPSGGILDGVLTTVFVLQVALVLWNMADKGMLTLFVMCVLLTDAVISRVKTVSASIGRFLSTWLHKHGYVACDPLANKTQLKKWTDQSWQLFVHVLFASIEGYILSQEPWLDNPATAWMPHPDIQAATHRTDLVVLYVVQLAVWIYTCLVHRLFDERRKDYFVMYAHHVVTIGLVALSWSTGYLRIGLVVLWPHDVSDIFIDSLKMVNYLKLEGPKGFFASEITYVSTIVGWIYWRLYLYPFKAIKGAAIDSYRVLAPPPRVDDGFLGLFPPEAIPAGICNVLLVTLLIMHVYWSFLLLRIGYRVLAESTREASRQEYEGDSDDDREDVEDKEDTNMIADKGADSMKMQ